MRCVHIPILAAIILGVTGHAEAQQAVSVAGFQTAIEQSTQIGVTKSQKLAWMRQQVRESRYGQRGLENLFKDFEGKNFIDSTIPGVGKNFNALGSLSGSQAKGAVRTLLYATTVHQDARFELLGVDRPVNESYGRTDKDLVFRERATGQRCRVENKDVKPASQRADLERIKGQIDKMAAEYRRTGELQAWVNRQETIPEIKAYAKEKGVPVYEKTKQAEFTKVLDDFRDRSMLETRVQLASGALSTGAGIVLLYTSTKGLVEAIQSDRKDLAGRLGVLEQGSFLIAGGGLTASGVAQIGSQLASAESTLAKLGGVAKWGGRAGLAGIIIGEGIGIGIVAYEWDGMTERQRTVAVAQHGVSIGTLVVGFGIGFFAGIETGPGALALGLATAGASYAAAKVTTAIVEDSYNRLDGAQKVQVREYIYHCYGVNP